MISYPQAIIIGLLQGITELFPISSLGHSILIPALLGWNQVVASQAAQESFFLAFLVGLHMATALALMWFYRNQWARIMAALLHSLRTRTIHTPDQRLGWLLLIATIPAALTGITLEHALRTLFAKPLAAATFLTCNGAILLAGEHLRRRTVHAVATNPTGHITATSTHPSKRELSTLGYGEALLIGTAQILAFLAGISRSGTTMVAGLARGLDHQQAAHFAFLLATPIILAAGLYKLPDLLGTNGNGVHGQILAGSLAAALTAYLSVRYLTRYFQTHTLTPFAIYCLLIGTACIIKLA